MARYKGYVAIVPFDLAWDWLTGPLYGGSLGVFRGFAECQWQGGITRPNFAPIDVALALQHASYIGWVYAAMPASDDKFVLACVYTPSRLAPNHTFATDQARFGKGATLLEITEDVTIMDLVRQHLHG